MTSPHQMRERMQPEYTLLETLGLSTAQQQKTLNEWNLTSQKQYHNFKKKQVKPITI